MGTGKLEIGDSRDGSRLTVKLNGRLDSDSAPGLQQFLGDRLEGVTELWLDMENVMYVSSAGLRVFLVMTRQMEQRGGRMLLTKVNRAVWEVIAITGFDTILTLE